MRLIDADKLKKEVYTITEWNGDVHRIIYETSVDDAPTVDAIPREQIEAALEEMEALEGTEFHMPNTDYEAYAVAYHCVEILKKHMEASDGMICLKKKPLKWLSRH